MERIFDPDVKKMIRPMATSLKQLLQSLVKTNSVAMPPGGNETPAQLVLRAFFQAQGIQTDLYSTEFIVKSGHASVRPNRTYRGRKNLGARLNGTGRGKSLILNAHMDTVPAGKRPWTRSAWDGGYRDGAVHGLGSFDMKGGMVANAAVICALHKAGIRPGGDLLFESVVDEEWGGGGGTIAARLRSGNADACLIPEGTQLELYRATRGGFVVDLIVNAGEASAYFSKAEVPSPAIAIGRLLAWVDELSKQRAKIKAGDAYASFPDPVPVQVLAIEANQLGSDVPLSVPSEATVRLYVQFLPEEKVETIIAKMEKLLRTFEKRDPFFAKHPISWSPLIGSALKGNSVKADHPWTRCMAESAGAVMGRPVTITGAPYPCDAGLMQREFGIPTLLFGPCGNGAHNPDEYVDFESVLVTAEVLLAAAMRWTNC
jgi:acetylornithine deacetylase